MRSTVKGKQLPPWRPYVFAVTQPAYLHPCFPWPCNKALAIVAYIKIFNSCSKTHRPCNKNGQVTEQSLLIVGKPSAFTDYLHRGNIYVQKNLTLHRTYAYRQKNMGLGSQDVCSAVKFHSLSYSLS